MIKKTPSATSRDLFRSLLSDLINPKHELALLADKIDWSYYENEFKGFYFYDLSNRCEAVQKSDRQMQRYC
jgi:hypothetical protein